MPLPGRRDVASPYSPPRSATAISSAQIRGNMRRITGVICIVSLAGCAIEGVGWQGHVDAYNNAAAAGSEYAALNRGTRDSAWYAGWCGAIEPHFARMSDVHDRIDHYCQAMQRQPDDATAIQADLVSTLIAGGTSANDSRNSAYAAFGASMQAQQAKQVHCTSIQYGTTTNTDCR